jgi:hypothetical protein
MAKKIPKGKSEGIVCPSSIYGLWLPLWYLFGHCIVCPSSIYGLWLPLWYLFGHRKWKKDKLYNGQKDTKMVIRGRKWKDKLYNGQKDTKGVIRGRKWKKDKLYNGQKDTKGITSSVYSNFFSILKRKTVIEKELINMFTYCYNDRTKVQNTTFKIHDHCIWHQF